MTNETFSDRLKLAMQAKQFKQVDLIRAAQRRGVNPAGFLCSPADCLVALPAPCSIAWWRCVLPANRLLLFASHICPWLVRRCPDSVSACALPQGKFLTEKHRSYVGAKLGAFFGETL